MAFPSRLVALLPISLFVVGCASIPDATTPPVAAESLEFVQGEAAESKLLDVWIERFDYEAVDSEEAEETGTSKDIREAESRFVPVHLKTTLQATGYWGAVRVVPREGVAGGEVIVSGTIRRSDGWVLELDIEARDALGRVWLERTYSSNAVPANYDRLSPHDWDAFQGVYNEIANDLAEALKRLPADEAQRIRNSADLRFAAFIAPEPYADYLSRGEKGGISIERLPAENDPLYQNVQSLKARNDMLADILNARYNQFYDGMWEPYTNWRRSSLNEILALKRIEREAAAKKFGGIAAIAGAIGLAAAGGEVSSRTGVLQGVMIAGGALAIKYGIDQGKEAEIYKASISELGTSFESAVEPMVVEIEGETVELTGSAEAQFARWRELLRSRFATERGLADEGAAEDVEPGAGVESLTGTASRTFE